jgi:adenylate cyclase, class 2
MQFEVEQKFSVVDHGAIRKRLRDMGAECLGTDLQADTYFAHPARDFAQTDEALRLRRVGDENWITYKGPKVDSRTKTRRELELPLAAGPVSFEQYSELLMALGFRPVATVHKTRERWRLAYRHVPGQHQSERSCEVEIALDDVEQVGLFVELEVAATDDGLLLAHEVIDSLANDLGLSRSERRSYLELLLKPAP